MLIKDEFDVALHPLQVYCESGDGDRDNKLARMSIDKTFHGDLSAISKGEMLSAMTPVKGSAGYAAIELVSGTLLGKQEGSFHRDCLYSFMNSRS